MQTKLGVTEDQITRAYLDGELVELEVAIRSGFNGDSVLTARFLDSLAASTLGSATRPRWRTHQMMFTKQLP